MKALGRIVALALISFASAASAADYHYLNGQSPRWAGTFWRAFDHDEPLTPYAGHFSLDDEAYSLALADLNQTFGGQLLLSRPCLGQAPSDHCEMGYRRTNIPPAHDIWR